MDQCGRHLAEGRECWGGVEGGVGVLANADNSGSQGPWSRTWEWSLMAVGSLCRIIRGK